MSLHGNLKSIADAISSRSKLLNLTREETVELLNLYLEKTLVSPFKSSRDALHFIEHFPRKTPEKAERLTRFSSSEQRRRSAQSEAVRKALIEYTLASAKGGRMQEYIKKGALFERDVQRLFKSPVPGVEISTEEQNKFKAANDEVAFLFDSNRNWKSHANMQAKILAADPASAAAFRTKYSVPENEPLTADTIFEAYAKRRAAVTMERYNEYVEVVKKAEHNYDPSLSPQQMVVNFWQVNEASHFLAELNNIMSTGNKASMPMSFSDEQRNVLGDATRYENLAGIAICRFSMIANPLYSILDPDAMEQYDFTQATGLAPVYDSLVEGQNVLDEDAGLPIPEYDAKKLEQEVIDEFTARHSDKYTEEQLQTFFNNPVVKDNGTVQNYPLAGGNVFSDFDCYIKDFAFYFQNKTMPIADRADEILQNFGLSARSTSRYEGQPAPVNTYGEQFTSKNTHLDSSKTEQDATDLLAEGTPVAYELNGRTIVLSRRTDGKPSPENLTYEKPEALYNFGLKQQQQLFTRQLENSDSMFVRSSDAFKAMKGSLAAVGNLGELQPGEDPAEAEARFRKLLEDTEKYLIYKKDAGMLKASGQGSEATDDDDRSSYELERVETARRIREFAQSKLKELQLTRQARTTLKDFTYERYGKLIPVDEVARKHMIARSDMTVQLREQIKAAQDAAQAEAAAKEQAKEQPIAEANEEPAKEQPAAEANEEPAKEQPAAEANEEPAKEQPAAEANEEPAKEQPAAEANEEQAKEQPVAPTGLNLDDDDEWELPDDIMNLDSAKLEAELNDLLDKHIVVNDMPEIKFDDEDELYSEEALEAIDKQYTHADTRVTSFARTHITNSLKDHTRHGDALSSDECRSVLSGVLLYRALCKEADEHTAEEPGSLTDMLKNHPTIFTALHQKLMQSYTVNAFMQAMPDGSPVSMTEMNVLLEQMNNTPLNAVDLSANVMTADQCTELLTGQLLDAMVSHERAENKTGELGPLETLMTSHASRVRKFFEDNKDHAQAGAEEVDEHGEMTDARKAYVQSYMELGDDPADKIKTFLKKSDTMKDMMSKAVVNGQVSYLAVADLLKQIKAPDYLSNQSFLEIGPTNALMSELMLDKATDLKFDEDHPYQQQGERLAKLPANYRNDFIMQLEYSSIMDTMAENAGLKDKGKDNCKHWLSLNDFTSLLSKLPNAEDVLTEPVLPIEYCSEALAKDALDRMMDQEKKYMEGSQADLNASTRPLARLATIYPNAKEKLAQNLADSTSKRSLRAMIESVKPKDVQEDAIYIVTMVALVNSLDNKKYVYSAFDENILDQSMSCELLSDYMLDNMSQMYRSTHKGKAGCLEKLKQNDPEGYAKLRRKLAETEDVRNILTQKEDVDYERGIVPMEEEPTDKISLSKLDKLFPKVTNPVFCKTAVDKALAAVAAEKQADAPQRENVQNKNIQKEVKPAMRQ